MLEVFGVQAASEALAFGEPRPMFEIQQEAWLARRSSTVVDALRVVQTRIVHLGVPQRAVALAATASERGTAPYKAMRVLSLRPDHRHSLSAATGFDEATQDVLQAQADALKHLLNSEGYAQIEYEALIQKGEASGTEFNGIIDLLAIVDGKELILDHKRGIGNFAGYFAQLDADRGLLSKQDRAFQPDVEIRWIDRAEMEVQVHDKPK